MKALFKYHFKWIGLLLVVLGVALTVAYFKFNFRFAMPVFAVYSEFLEVKIFKSFTTNFADETILVCYLTGFFFLIFSEEKKEDATIKVLRIKAIQKSIIFYFLWLLFSILFIYGNGFITILVVNIISPFVIYLCFFRALVYADRKRFKSR